MRQRPRKPRSVLRMVRPPAVTDPPPAEAGASELPPASGAPGEERCLACGAALGADQEWCLECGVARTVIHPPPDWRLGVAIILAVIAIVALITVIVWP